VTKVDDVGILVECLIGATGPMLADKSHEVRLNRIRRPPGVANLVAKLAAPRTVWTMAPAHRPVSGSAVSAGVITELPSRVRWPVSAADSDPPELAHRPTGRPLLGFCPARDGESARSRPHLQEKCGIGDGRRGAFQ
jgi:hypothetical protein